MKTNKLRSKITSVIICAIFLLTASTIALATAGGFSSTYDMTGGLYSRNINNVGNNAVFTVSVSPTLGFQGSYITLKLQRKNTLGWSGISSSQVASWYTNSANLNGTNSGTYRVYYRNYTGMEMSGATTVTWNR